MFSNSRKSLVSRPRRGIALLVTILLLSFLVLIMVAMSSMVRVETQVATNQDAVAQARQNALTGLNIALGKLQETAGPDQRVTARADVLDDTVIPQANRYQMNMTGVWDTSGGGAPQLITWLVNGNEDLRTAIPPIAPDSQRFTGANPSARIFDVRDDDATDHPATEALYNDSQPAAATILTGTAAPNFRFGDGRVYLVANGSVDVQAGVLPPQPDSYKYAIDERVLLRKTPIIIDGGKLPGKAAGTDVTVGNYAYWVGDAGIKASLAAANHVPEVAYDIGNNQSIDYLGGNAASDPDYINRKMLNGLQLQGSRLDLVFRPGLLNNNGYLPDIFVNGNTPGFLGVTNSDRRAVYGVLAHPLTRDAYLRLFSGTQVQQFIHEGPFTDPTLDGVAAVPILAPAQSDFKTVINARLKQLYHDVTPQTFSVATNMLTGGLRTDLSQADGIAALPATLEPGIKFYTDLWKGAAPYSHSKAITDRGLLQPNLRTGAVAQAIPTATDTAYPIAPVITEFSLITAAVTPAAGGTIQINFTGEIELWNPYNAALTITNDLSLNIMVEDDTDATVSQITARGTPSDYPSNYSAQETLAGLANLALSTPKPTFNPGEIKRFTFTATQTTAKDPDGVAINVPAGTYTGVDFTIIDKTKLTVELEEAIGGGSVVSKYDKIDMPVGTPSGSDLFYEFRLIDWVNGVAENDWLAFDPRGPSLGTAHVLPGNIGKAASEFGNQSDYYAPAQTAVLFDVPRQEVLGVGSLRHIVYRAGAPLYAVGRTGVGAANNLFEEYFFSGIPQDKTVNGWTPLGGTPLANTSTVIVDPTPSGSSSADDLWDGTDLKLTGITSERSAQYVLVRDTLNVNSTSDVAWRSLLGGALPTLANPPPGGALIGGDFSNNSESQDYVWRSGSAGYPAAISNSSKDVLDIWANWRFDNGAAAQTEPVHNVFFRFPHTAPGLGANYPTLRDSLAGTSNPRASFAARETTAFRLGVRELSRTQIEEMAWWVTYKIKNPGGAQRPFRSVAHFIDEGVLEYAIGQVGAGAPVGVTFPAAWTNNDPINNPADRTQSLPIGSAAFLTQGDILELIGHRLVARSDTFIIRAYGDVTEPTVFASGAPKVISRVWVEATVQRMPMKHPSADEPDDNMTSTYDGTGPQVGNFGRQFKVISMRWLRPEEI
jgi:hypothetical protein